MGSRGQEDNPRTGFTNKPSQEAKRSGKQWCQTANKIEKLGDQAESRVKAEARGTEKQSGIRLNPIVQTLPVPAQDLI